MKMEVLWLKSQGLPHGEITRLTKLSENTVRSYLRAYLQGGIEKLKVRKVHRPQSELLRHRETLESYFREYPPSSIEEAIARIEELTAVKRGVTQVRQFIKGLGLCYLRPGMFRAPEQGFAVGIR